MLVYMIQYIKSTYITDSYTLVLYDSIYVGFYILNHIKPTYRNLYLLFMRTITQTILWAILIHLNDLRKLHQNKHMCSDSNHLCEPISIFYVNGRNLHDSISIFCLTIAIINTKY